MLPCFSWSSRYGLPACAEWFYILVLVRFWFFPSYSWHRLPQLPFVWGSSCSLVATLWCEMCEKARKEVFSSVWKLMVKVHVSMGFQAQLGGRHMGHTRPFNSAKLHLRCTGPPFGNFRSVFPVPWLKELVQSIQTIP